MHHKAIKAQIRKQLKIRYLNWHRLSKKEKKAVAKKVLNEVVANCANCGVCWYPAERPSYYQTSTMTAR